MTAPNLIAIVGAGSALSLAGFALMGGAAGAALAYYFPQIHLSIWLLIVGGVMLVLGLALVERGGTKTVEKVENELSMPNMVSNFPWTFVALGAGGTLFTVWLLRKFTSSPQVTRTEIKPIYVPTQPSSMAFSQPQRAEPPKRLTLSDVLVPLGFRGGIVRHDRRNEGAWDPIAQRPSWVSGIQVHGIRSLQRLACQAPGVTAS